MHRNRSVSTHQFAMIPRADIPRSRFRRQTAHKTTFDAGYLVPIYADEVLPGDTFNLKLTAFARMATPIFPVMDNLHMETFFFFVPNRLLWDNWQKFMGEQTNPGDSTDFLVPQCESPILGYQQCSLQDYLGLPTAGQIPAGNVYSHSALWLRAYNLIYNEWFRDENLIDSLAVPKDDGPDDPAIYTLRRRGKRHDYFTSALPWPSKGAEIGFGLVDTQAPIFANPGASAIPVQTTVGGGMNFNGQWGQLRSPITIPAGTTTPINLQVKPDTTFEVNSANQPPSEWLTHGSLAPTDIASRLYADLSLSTSLTINQLRTSFQVQKLLERDARGGTRYTEILRSHFGVTSPDARLQRPEYLGGGKCEINISPVPQTSATTADSPQGNLSAFGTALSRQHGFSQAFVEHGVILGLVNIRADLTYQQGLERMWSRRTRFDFYFPAFATLGEQTVLNQEIYATGMPINPEMGLADVDKDVFGYQERWAEYRYKPSMITGLFRSTAAGTLDSWHLAQRFNNLPTLSQDFIEDKPPVSRVVAAGEQANGQQFIFDSFFDIVCARPMPLYSVPGLIDHF